MREIKFRAWDESSRVMLADVGFHPHIAERHDDGSITVTQSIDRWMLMQYTGLKDKNGDIEIYEGDIIDTEGNIIGNQYEAPTLLERKSNLLIQGFGTKAWLTTYQEAVDRGCNDA